VDGFVSAAVGNGVQLGANDPIGSLTIGTTAVDDGSASSTASSGGAVAVNASTSNAVITPANA